MAVTAVELKAARLERQRARIQKAREQVDAADARVAAAQEALAESVGEPVQPGVAAMSDILAADTSAKARPIAPQLAIAAGVVLALGLVFVIVKRRRARRRDEEL